MTEPRDEPGDGRPIPVVPGPASVSVVPIDVTRKGQPPLRVLRLEVITDRGSAFAHMEPDEAIEFAGSVVAVARQAKTGLLTPPPGFVIGGPVNGRLPGSMGDGR